jgi:histone H3/H4
MADLIFKSNVQEALGEMQVSADLYEALDDEVEEVLEEAVRRARANDRTTVMAQDL